MAKKDIEIIPPATQIAETTLIYKPIRFVVFVGKAIKNTPKKPVNIKKNEDLFNFSLRKMKANKLVKKTLVNPIEVASDKEM